MPIDLSTVTHTGTVREIALTMIADLKPGQAITAYEIAARAHVTPRAVLQTMQSYPWKMLVRQPNVRASTAYMSKETYEAHQERSELGSVKTGRKR